MFRFLIMATSLVSVLLLCQPVYSASSAPASAILGLSTSDVLVGELTIRSSSYGYAIAMEAVDGGSWNFFFKAETPPPYLAVREEAGTLVFSSEELQLILPSQDLFLRLAVVSGGREVEPWSEPVRRRQLLLHRVGELREVQGVELITYRPALEGLEADALLSFTDAGFLAQMDRPRVSQESIFTDNPDQPGDGGCKAKCSVECLGGASCSADCPNRCATCECDRDMPMCKCTNM